MKPLRVGLIGYDGVQALDIIGPSDAFTIADIETDNGQRRPCYEVIIIGITNKPFRAESDPLMRRGHTSNADPIGIPFRARSIELHLRRSFWRRRGTRHRFRRRVPPSL